MTRLTCARAWMNCSAETLLGTLTLRVMAPPDQPPSGDEACTGALTLAACDAALKKLGEPLPPGIAAGKSGITAVPFHGPHPVEPPGMDGCVTGKVIGLPSDGLPHCGLGPVPGTTAGGL